jgi:hypothetical protein
LDPFNLHVSLVHLVTGRELGWDGVVIIEVDVRGVRSLRNVRRRVENAVVVIVVVDVAAAVVIVASVF